MNIRTPATICGTCTKQILQAMTNRGPLRFPSDRIHRLWVRSLGRSSAAPVGLHHGDKMRNRWAGRGTLGQAVVTLVLLGCLVVSVGSNLRIAFFRSVPIAKSGFVQEAG